MGLFIWAWKVSVVISDRKGKLILGGIIKGEYLKKCCRTPLILMFLIVTVILVSQCTQNDNSKSPQIKSYKRIISLMPSNTEILYALGLGENVVGVSSFCEYPPDASNKTKVGGYMDLDFETLIALNPDLVVGMPAQSEVLSKLEALNITTMEVESNSLEGIYKTIRILGTTTGRIAEAERIVDDIERQIIQYKRPNLTRVMLVVGRSSGSLQGLYVAGGKTYLGELIDAAGGYNIFTFEKGYIQPTLEKVISMNPEMIVEIRTGKPLTVEQKKQMVGDYMVLQNIDAVINGNIHILTESYLTIPGPRVVLAYKKLKELLDGQ